MVRMVCWNVAKRHESWRALRAMEQIDVALLQETRPPPDDVDFSRDDIDPEEWPRGNRGRTAVVRLNRRVEVEFFEKDSYAKSDHLCIAAARVIPPHREPFDYVFASRSMVGSVRVRALNEPDEWGPSDHCRLLIEVE